MARTTFPHVYRIHQKKDALHLQGVFLRDFVECCQNLVYDLINMVCRKALGGRKECQRRNLVLLLRQLETKTRR